MPSTSPKSWFSITTATTARAAASRTRRGGWNRKRTPHTTPAMRQSVRTSSRPRSPRSVTSRPRDASSCCSRRGLTRRQDRQPARSSVWGKMRPASPRARVVASTEIAQHPLQSATRRRAQSSTSCRERDARSAAAGLAYGGWRLCEAFTDCKLRAHNAPGLSSGPSAERRCSGALATTSICDSSTSSLASAAVAISSPRRARSPALAADARAHVLHRLAPGSPPSAPQAAAPPPISVRGLPALARVRLPCNVGSALVEIDRP